MTNPEGRRTCLYDTEQLGAVLDHVAWQAAGRLTACNVPPYEDDFRIDLLQPRGDSRSAR